MEGTVAIVDLVTRERVHEMRDHLKYIVSAVWSELRLSFAHRLFTELICLLARRSGWTLDRDSRLRQANHYL